MSLAPIALFAYNRPRHVQQAVESLLRNELAPESDLYIFSDAPATAAAATAVQQVRRYIRAVRGFSSISIVERTINLGLADSIIDGVTRLCREHGRVIVLEDDLVLSPFFLRFMNDALEFYRTEEKVISIHGYLYPLKAQLPETFFIKDTGSWGWATWERGWRLFDSDGRRLLSQLKQRGLTKKFDINGSYPFTRMLARQTKGLNNSWAIRWQASAFLHDRLTLFPGRSLVKNIGHDGSGEHCGDTSVFDTALAAEAIRIRATPLQESGEALRAFEEYFRSIKQGPFRRLSRRIKVGLKGLSGPSGARR